MNFNRVKPQKGYELVMNAIKQRIIAGELKPGEKLASVVDLAAAFGMGRSTVREALSALKAMGWIDIMQGGGTFVCEQLPLETTEPLAELFAHADSLKELLEVRKVLESGCASLAAQKRTDQDLNKLADILDRMKENLHDETTGEEADAAFHLQIAAAAHNSMLLQMMESLSAHLHESMKESRKLWFYGEQSSAARLLEEHTRIYSAILEKRSEQAAALMLNHLHKVEAVLYKAMN